MASQRTPLYDLLLDQNARIVDFAGWEMPVQYAGIKQEHRAVRQQAGVFDISHMGKFVLRGPGLLAALDGLVPTDLSRLQPGKAQYTVLLTPEAGIVDDLLLYRQEDDSQGERVVTIVNAATTAKDKAWLRQALEPTIELQDLSAEQVLLAVQGPYAATKLQALVDIDLSTIKRYCHGEATLWGQPAFLARTGYTGEDGFEIMVPAETGRRLWSALLQAEVTPCGLGARDTLRLEAAMALYGQDITEATTPLEAGLGWLVHLDRKGDFLGRPILEQQKQQGVSRKLVGLRMEGRHIARHGYPVLQDDQPVGEVTSGTLSPSLGYPIALAYVPPELGQVGQAVTIEIRGQGRTATVVKRPFYRART
ncbi:Aminomethyltransferase [Halomicronema hongdechloris C2206]|uniref:Aminomethyltransferase n=1 Tax=Halomicronema hongdechloris C2206 TaxID=1641165 RepID=A0A1Z3HNZ1_9CYAN|nr:glycine cleavage system aminomethyltransferase GcvT [Halomicronema hongdechloris]ASC72011.1 Aminomethyltransferase [Halomicronema hongdechloris C2206]